MARILLHVIVAVEVDADTHEIHSANVDDGAPECYDLASKDWRDLEDESEEMAASRADDYVREALEALSGMIAGASPTEEEAPAL